jgi:hypothetical protein
MRELGDGRPPGAEGEDQEQEVVGVDVLAEDAVALGLGERLDLLAVVGGTRLLVGDLALAVGERLPVQEAGQLGVGGVVVINASGPLADVLLAQRLERDGGRALGKLVCEDGGGARAI